MDDELLKILQGIIGSEDDTGCSHDPDDPHSIPLTVVNKNDVDALRSYLDTFYVGSGVMASGIEGHLKGERK
jgi:hypothetical protein